jgi:Ca-activated chloride channel family protein
MSFIWPPVLLTLLLVPAGVGLYLFLDTRRRRRLARYGGAGPVSSTTGRASIRSRIAPVLMLCGLVLLPVAMARPQAVVSLPQEEGTVVLAFDVSASMAATDLAPTRMAAAKVAAKDFVMKQPAGVTIGVVAFSDSGVSVQQPSNDQSAVLASLKVIAVAEAGPWANNYYSNASPNPSPTATPTPVPAGTHAPAAIVLLSDGENNENPDPATAAKAAADQGIRIYTIGIGTPSGTTVTLDGFQIHTQLDAATLQSIAQTTDGKYYAATDAQQLLSIYDNLDTQLILQPQMVEITGLLAGVSLLLLLAGAAASMMWLGRLP